MKENKLNEHIKGWRSSGLSQKEYCKQNNIKVSSLRYEITKENRKNVVSEEPSKFEELIFSDEKDKSSSDPILEFRVTKDGKLNIVLNLNISIFLWSEK